MRIVKLSLIALIALNLNAQGLSQEQINEVKAIMKQTQELVDEQKNTQTRMGEDIFNDKTKDINKNVQTSVGVNPLGLFGKEEHPQITNLKENSQFPKEEYIGFENSVATPPREYSKDELEIMQSAIRTQDLKALQKKFHSKNIVDMKIQLQSTI